MTDVTPYSWLFEPEPWRDHAACKGMPRDLFFPKHVGKSTTAAAKQVCASCPVREDCLDYATRTRQTFGVWGGLSEKQRRTVRRQYRRGAA